MTAGVMDSISCARPSLAAGGVRQGGVMGPTLLSQALLSDAYVIIAAY